MSKKLLFVFLIPLFGLGIWIYSNVNIDIWPDVEDPMVGKVIPNFEYYDPVEKKRKSIINYLKNKDTFILFWSSGCNSCEAYLQYLVSIKNVNSLNIIGINHKDMNEIGELHFKQNDNPFDLIIFDHDGVISSELGVYGIPEMFVVDSNKVIIKKLYNLNETKEYVQKYYKL
jgi:cytochrome c biogenesis protein CcmG/thiol:disulfide interchange protein DsbE